MSVKFNTFIVGMISVFELLLELLNTIIDMLKVDVHFCLKLYFLDFYSALMFFKMLCTI